MSSQRLVDSKVQKIAVFFDKKPVRPLEAKADRSRSQSCVWHIGAGWKRPTGPEVMNYDNITLGRPENTHLGSSGPLEASGGP